MHFCIVEFLSQIEQYVSGNLSYEEGVEIFNKVSNNNGLKTVFALGEDDYSREKLRSEFQAILSKQQPVVIDGTTQSAASFIASASKFESFTVSKKKGSIDIQKLPPTLLAEYYKLSPIIREMASFHSKLFLYVSDEDRFIAAKRIVELGTARRMIFQRLDHYQTTGHDHPAYIQAQYPEFRIEEKVSNAYSDAQYQLKLLRSRRSKLKNKPDRFHDLQAVNKKIAHYESIKPDGGTTV